MLSQLGVTSAVAGSFATDEELYMSDTGQQIVDSTCPHSSVTRDAQGNITAKSLDGSGSPTAALVTYPAFGPVYVQDETAYKDYATQSVPLNASIQNAGVLTSPLPAGEC